jgi:hypothetical protein
VNRRSYLPILAALAGFFIIGTRAAAAFDLTLPPVKESEAYRKFLKRPKNELSKLLYLIDRYKDTKIKVIYDGFHYDAAHTARVTKKFLFGNYKNESALHWINAYCHRTDPRGNLILVKTPDGDVREARDLLLAELEILEKAV